MLFHEVFSVDENVAFSPMPDDSSLPYIAKEFNVVVAAVELHELAYDPARLSRLVKFIHIPVPDYAGPDLWQLYRGVREIARAASSGQKVLVHCLAGRGRSATLVAGYLVYRYGMSARRAIEVVRSVRPGAVESAWQRGALRGFEAALTLGDTVLEEYYGDERTGEALRLVGQLSEALKSVGLGSMWLAHSMVRYAVEAARGGTAGQDPVSKITEPLLAVLDFSRGFAEIEIERVENDYRVYLVCTSYVDFCDSFMDAVRTALSSVFRVRVNAEVLYE
ncbi:hypothetical protein PABY_10520 [Pyrodictium abyssi]|uniref:Dual specificity protein phosphatase n=2 Tax=Pyrodictium abyssi TaxID=54256 RepID=A0ABN6ZSF7_9CREN|nr:hypothetical protein PABY_10520 [Pyrodictium abyssi]